MKRCSFLFTFFMLMALLGCKNPFLMEMFGDKDLPAIADIVITNNHGQRINTFDSNVMSYAYTVDSDVRIQLSLKRGTEVRWGYNNFNNPYNGEILVRDPKNEDKQLFISVDARRGPVKVYVFTFSRNPIDPGTSDTGNTWYVSAVNSNDTYSGSVDAPFKTLGRAVQAVKNSSAGVQTIYVSGTLNYASENTTLGDKDIDSVFFINGLGTTLVTLIGENGATLENETIDNNNMRRTLKIDNSTVTVKNLTIKSNVAANKDGGGIYIGTNAAVTLADGADVQGMGTASDGKGVYVGGTLSFSGTGTVSTVGNDSCDVYLPSGRSIQIADALTIDPVAKITTQDIPTENQPVQVLDSSSSLVSAHHMQFSASNTQYAITSDGMMKPMELTGNVYYVKNSGGLLPPDGLSINTAFESLDAAVAAASTHATIKTICVVGTLTTGNSANSDSESVFVINNTGSTQITIRGIDGILSATETTKRVVKIPYGSGPVKFESIRITGANTAVDGGGLFIDTDNEVEFGNDVEISNNTVIGSSVVNAGGVLNAGTLTISGNNVSISHNSLSSTYIATSGGVCNEGTLIISGNNANISYNTVSSTGGTSHSYGGGVYNGNGQIIISGSNANINYNTVSFGSLASTTDGGGGVYLNGGTFAISGSNASISNNRVSSNANSYGGGVFNYGGSFTISGSNARISYNRANSDGDGYMVRGGGVYNENGAFTISGNNTSISYNATKNNGYNETSGGGVYNDNTGTLIISGSSTSISNNAANGINSYGGGVFNNTGGTVTVYSAVTINKNTAGNNGGGLCGVLDAATNSNYKYGTGDAANSPNDYANP